MEFNEIESKFYNIIKNDFLDFTEIVYYKVPFMVTTGNIETIDFETGETILKNSNIDKSRKFEVINGVAVQKSNSIDIEKMKHTIKESRKRAIDNLMAYVLCNRWKYWLTITFSPEFVNRDIDEEIKQKYFLFRKKLQYHYPNCTYIAVPERHEKGALHFHILIGNCNLSKFMKVKAVNKKNGKLIKSFGQQVYNFSLFDWGYSTIVKTNEDNLKIANYMAKYMIKDFGNIGYNKKSFYHSKNLIYKDKQLLFFNDKKIFNNEFENILIEKNKYKENDKIVVYRLYKNGG